MNLNLNKFIYPNPLLRKLFCEIVQDLFVATKAIVSSVRRQHKQQTLSEKLQ